MRYQPNFCSNCAEPIDKYNRKLFASTRFCENCEPELRFVDWLPTGGMIVSILFGLLGFGSYLKSPEKPLSVTSKAVAVVDTNRNTAAKNSNATKSVNQSFVGNGNVATNQSQPKLGSTVPRSSVSAEIEQNPKDETVYYCGAQTKKGNPCTRKVKSAGRCWQHEAQPSMLSKEKLVANQ